MNFSENKIFSNNKENIKFIELADKLDELKKEFIERFKLAEDAIPYVNWLIQDLRKGNLENVRINYEQQRDKYDNKPEIRHFLEDNNLVDKGIDWKAFKKLNE